jgi:putative hydrolase of HD superfamily
LDITLATNKTSENTPKQSQLNEVLDFIKFTLAFQKVERTIRLPNRDMPENDAEHSYQLTMLAWYLNDRNHYQLKNQKLLELALVHDLVEVYAGDTWVFDQTGLKESKAEREKAAIHTIHDQFPDFPSLHAAITEYEALETNESKFVYALDKIIPILNLYLEGHGFWKDKNVSFEELLNNKRPKVMRWPDLVPLFEDLMSKLQAHPEFFAQK